MSKKVEVRKFKFPGTFSIHILKTKNECNIYGSVFHHYTTETEEESLNHLVTWIKKKIGKQKKVAQKMLDQYKEFEAMPDNELLERYEIINKDKK